MSGRCKGCLFALLLVFVLSQTSLFTSSYAQVQNQTRKPITTEKPASAKEKEAASAKEKESDYSQEAFVIDQMKSFYRYEVDGTGERELNVRVKVQSEAGVQNFGQLVFPYSSANEKLEVDFVRVQKIDGSVVNASPSEFQDLTAPIAREAPVYTDLRQKHITVPGLRPGDVLEYHIVWRLVTPLAQNHFWLQHNFVSKEMIVLDDQLEVNVPVASKVKLKTQPGFEPTIKELADRRVYSWKKANLKRPEKTEDDEAQNKKDESEEKPPQVQLTTFQSWDDVGRWYVSLERDRIVPNDKIRAKAEELVRDSKTDQEKVEALYAFVARNVRYVSLSFGEGRYQPHAAPDVLANQYGDCKDKHTLLSSMLLAAGLRAYPALMNSSRKIDVDVPSPAQFDHVISVIPLGTQMLWADTTPEVAPFRLLASPLRDKKALVVPANEPARLETTPAEPPFLSSQVVEIEGQVSDLGKLSAHSHLTLRGDSELLFRILFRRTPRNDWKQLGYYLTMLTGIRGEITEIKPSEPAATEKAFEVEYDISQDDFLDWSSKKTKVRIPLPALNLGNIEPEGEDSSKPFQVGPPIQITYRLKLSLPSKYQTRVPLPLTVNRDYANYGSSYTLQGNTLLVERKLNLRQHELPASRLQDYHAFVAATRADEAQGLTLETEIAGTPTIPGSVKVEELIQAAEAAAKNDNYPLVEELLKRVLEKEPKHKEARRQLAWALFGQYKFDDAISVLREQIKINPFDDYSYNLMGRIFWRQQKYPEAEDSFRRQIEITPLDQDAHGNLGQLLVEWRKYKEAVPELEKATSLNPEGEILFISLGRAYLNLGEIENATKAFDKAVKLAPGPLVWNDVSYNLALSKVQLDKALQYAESAVTQVVTELRNIELQRMTLRDLYGVTSLAAYWDTLGWVHFQKGELELAEKYVSASWALSQHSEVGYHLGQINEKLEKKEAAIHMYALAAVAGRLVPEARESLDKLVGKDKSEALMRKADDEMRDIRTIKLSPNSSNAKQSTAEAQFYVVLVPGASRNAQVAEVKFIRGDEKLRPLGEALKGANYNFVFPDESTTKVVRRGTLFCLAMGGGCSFIMMNPEFIPSID